MSGNSAPRDVGDEQGAKRAAKTVGKKTAPQQRKKFPGLRKKVN